MIFREIFGLNHDPFAPASPAVVAEPVKLALAQITHALARGARAIVVAGAPGAGKTLLLRLVHDAYIGAGRSVTRVDLVPLLPSAVDDNAGLILIDEADNADPMVLQAALSEECETPRMIVLACRSEAAARLCDPLGAVLIHLAPLSPAQAKDFLIERVTNAGRADLFTPAALDRLIEAGVGSPQALRGLAGMAMFLAAYAQALQIDASHVEEAVRSQRGFLPAEVRSGDVAASGQMQDGADGQEPVSSFVPPAIIESTRERRRWFRVLPARRDLAAAALLLAAIAVPGSLLFGTEGNRVASVAPVPVAPAAVSRPRQTAADSLRGLDRVARAMLPGQVVLAIVPLAPLQQISIGPVELGALPAPRTARRNVPPLATAVAVVPSPPSVTSIAGSQAVIATPPTPPPAAEHLPAPPAHETSAALRESPGELLAENAEERGDGNAPARAIPAVPPKYMTANAMALALLDIGEQAGLKYDDEFVAFRACVFRRVSPGGAEQRAFWRAVEVCIR